MGGHGPPLIFNGPAGCVLQLRSTPAIRGKKKSGKNPLSLANADLTVLEQAEIDRLKANKDKLRIREARRTMKFVRWNKQSGGGYDA